MTVLRYCNLFVTHLILNSIHLRQQFHCFSGPESLPGESGKTEVKIISCWKSTDRAFLLQGIARNRVLLLYPLLMMKKKRKQINEECNNNRIFACMLLWEIRRVHRIFCLRALRMCTRFSVCPHALVSCVASVDMRVIVPEISFANWRKWISKEDERILFFPSFLFFLFFNDVLKGSFHKIPTYNNPGWELQKKNKMKWIKIILDTTFDMRTRMREYVIKIHK